MITAEHLEGREGPTGIYILRLYIARGAPTSMQALANLAAICEENLAGRSQLEVIDLLQEPLRALDDNILVTPTLLKLSPPPASRVIGSLAERAKVLAALGLT